jgi:hypothetical protein
MRAALGCMTNEAPGAWLLFRLRVWRSFGFARNRILEGFHAARTAPLAMCAFRRDVAALPLPGRPLNLENLGNARPDRHSSCRARRGMF